MDEDNAVGIALCRKSVGATKNPMYRPTPINPSAAAENHGIILPASGWKACGDEYLNQLMPMKLIQNVLFQRDA